MNERMTSLERVKRCFNRQDQDRVPRFDQIWPETLERWKQEGMTGDPAETFRHDIGWMAWIGPAPLTEEQTISEDDHTKVVRGTWGSTLKWWKQRTGTPEHIGFECVDPDIWRTKYKPAFERQAPCVNMEWSLQQYKSARAAGKWTCFCGIDTYEALKMLMGDEIAWSSLACEPEWIKEIGRTYTDAVLRDAQYLWDHGVQADGFWLFEDVAYSNGPLCSPAMYRDLIWPQHRRIADWAHARGMNTIFHTDGDINTYIELIIEAGFDALQPLEAKAKMDIRKLVGQFGSRVGYFGNIDMMVAGSNDPAKIEHEMKTKLAAGMSTRGYMYHSDHSVPPGVSWATYQLMMQLLEQYGRYE